MKVGKQIQDQLQYRSVSEETSEKAAQLPTKNDKEKKPDEVYKEVLSFSEKGERSLFKNKNYKISVSIG